MASQQQIQQLLQQMATLQQSLQQPQPYQSAAPYQSASQPYQSASQPYPSVLLNDLHQYFPAILYDSNRFTNTTDLMNYIQSQMRANFDLFSNNRSNYQAQHTPTRHTRRLSPPPIRRVSTATTATATPLSPVNPRRQQPNTQPLRDALPLQEDELTEEENSIANLLTQLFPPMRSGNMTHLYTFTIPSNFHDSVPVPATTEQLAASTTVYTLTADSGENCSVCQDSMNTGATVRKVNHCGHTFHRTCVDTWFLTNVHCPTCRHDIRELGATNNR